jgi:sugar phosphate isomerase/epimerase
VGYLPLLALPAPSLFGLTFKQQVRILKQAGFQGIELFMFNHPARHLKQYRNIAKEAHIRLSLHQPWSYNEAKGLLINKVLDKLDYLPKDPYTLRDIIAGGDGELFVAYCDRRAEVTKIQDPPVKFAFQTACVWNGEGKDRTHRIPYEEFVNSILPTNIPIVFDTFHLLEWRYGGLGGKALASHSAKEIADELLKLWRLIGPERIAEIHWNDFVDSLGGGGEDGRECLPGEGKLALGLQMLANEIIRDDWHGYIIPEVSPFQLFPYRERTLIALRERMEQFFV